MSPIFLMVIFIIYESIAAPTDGPVRIALSLPNSSEFVSRANEKLSSYSDAALAINELVTSNLVTAGDNLNSASSIIKDQLQAAGSQVSQNVDAAANVVGQTVKVVQTAASERAKSLLDGAEIVTNQKAAIVQNIAKQVQKPTPQIGIFSDRTKYLDSAVLEQEDFGSRILSQKDNLGTLFTGVFQPRPIVDTITEEEKYGNRGDRFETIGKALVSGTESITGFITNAANIPFDFVKQLTRSASASLNNLGSRLIGL